MALTRTSVACPVGRRRNRRGVEEIGGRFTEEIGGEGDSRRDVCVYHADRMPGTKIRFREAF